MAALAEFEQDLLRERVQSGIAVWEATRSAYQGRPLCSASAKFVAAGLFIVKRDRTASLGCVEFRFVSSPQIGGQAKSFVPPFRAYPHASKAM